MVATDTEQVRLWLGGDVMLGRLVNDVVVRNGPDYPLQSLAAIRPSTDIFFVNLECAIASPGLRWPGEKAFYFRADPPAAEVLVSAGATLVNLANNHALDADVQGLDETRETLARHGILSVGAGRNSEEAEALVVVEVNGVRVGVIACCDHEPEFAATADGAGISYLNLARANDCDRLIARATAAVQEVDHLVVCLHWLSNWVTSVPARARELARRLADAGARVVWGHSPHHILGTEFLGRCVVLYSTGGLLDDYAIDPWFHNDRQLLYELTLSRNDMQLVARPLQLRVGMTSLAQGEAFEWIVTWLGDACRMLGSTVLPRADNGLSIEPSHGSRHV